MMSRNIIISMMMLNSLFVTTPSLASPPSSVMFNPKTTLEQSFDVPDISGGVSLIELQKEQLIGEKVYRQVYKQMPVIQDPWLEDQLMLVFSQILSQSKTGQPIALLLINDPQINAFAVPGGLFALNTGLILSAKTMGEVAGVMAHEVAHVAQRHYSRSKEAFKGQGLLALAGILVGAAVASQVDAEAGTAVMVGTQAALLDKQLSYSRDQEREADRIGMQYLYTAGYDPHHMANFFETMQRKSPQIGFLPEFWLTHPLTTARMSEARLRANQYPKIRQDMQAIGSDFELIQYYIGVISKRMSESQLKLLAQQNNTAAKLALMALYIHKHEWEKASVWIKQLDTVYAQHVLFNLLKADYLLAQRQDQQAYQTIERLYKIMPENRALAYKLAEILIYQKKGQAAHDVLLPFSQKNPRDSQVWRLLQQANVIEHTDISAIQVLRYRAEAEYWMGDEEQGIKSLLHAQRLAKEKSNQSLISRIDARLKQMQNEHKQNI